MKSNLLLTFANITLRLINVVCAASGKHENNIINTNFCQLNLYILTLLVFILVFIRYVGMTESINTVAIIIVIK